MPRIDANQARELMTGDPQPGQRYRHYENGKAYTVIARSIDKSDGFPLVTYRDDDGVCWTCTLQGFNGRAIVELDKERVPRFQRVED